jgi:hypothetical protein
MTGSTVSQDSNQISSDYEAKDGVCSVTNIAA